MFNGMRYIYNILSQNFNILPKYDKNIDDINTTYNIFTFFMISILIVMLVYLIFLFDEKEIKLIIS